MLFLLNLLSLSVDPFFIHTKLSDAWKTPCNVLAASAVVIAFSQLSFVLDFCFVFLRIFYINFVNLKLVQIKDGASLS
jgi:hypothetical protein